MERGKTMTRAEALRKIIKDVPGVHFVTADGRVFKASELLDIYDKLNENIILGNDEPKTEETEKKPQRNRDIDRGKVKALYKAGWKTKEIADECKCSVATVYKIVNET